ncbi:MAG: ankyrin repeat domain-containing protein [Candidatus Riflebacteria bacterium]
MSRRIRAWESLIGAANDKGMPITDLFHRVLNSKHNAIIKGKSERIDWNGVSSETLNLADMYGYTMLAYASVTDDEELTGFLLSKGASPDIKMTRNQTALLIAARKKAKKAIKVLMQAKAKTDIADDKGETALHHAAREDLSDIILNSDPASTNFEIKDKRGFTPLDWAAKKNRLKSVIELVIAGASPHCNLKKAPTVIDGYLILCRKLEDPAQAARIMAERDPGSLYDKLRNTYSLPPEMPIDLKTQDSHGENQ